MGDLSDFRTGQIVAAFLAVASVIKTATLLSVPRAAVSKVMTAYANHGKTSSAERKSGQKPKLSARDCCTLKRIVSKNHRTTATKVTAELDIHLGRPFPQKQSDTSFTNPTSTVELELLNLWLLKTMIQGKKDGVIKKSVYLKTGNM